MSEDRLATRLGTLRGGLTATATVITAVLGVVFLLLPNWRPLPRDKIDASVKVTDVEGGVLLREWARRQYPTDPDGELRRLLDGKPLSSVESSTGLVLYVELTANGFKRRSIKLRTRVYDVKTKQASGDNAPTLLPKAGRLQVDAPSRSSVQLLLVGDLTVFEGDHFVRVEAYDEDGILAYANSPVIRGTD